MRPKTKKIKPLTRIEGESALTFKRDAEGRLRARFQIEEAPRFFEAFLKNRHLNEVPDIVARICGICPVVHQIAAVRALENACGVEVAPAVSDLRALMICGEWIESHALHIFFLHAPGYLDYADALRMGRDFPDILARGLKIKKSGNELVALIGGREIHPINLRVGGFYRLPRLESLSTMIAPLEQALAAAVETVTWTAQLPLPEFTHDPALVALEDGGGYPMLHGDAVRIDDGPPVAAVDYEDQFTEKQVKDSSALYSETRGGETYLVGPLARFNLSSARLSPAAKKAAAAIEFSPPCRNPFQSIIIRSLEMVHACEESLRLIRTFTSPEYTAASITPRPAVGVAFIEAPRGLLFHRYRIDAEGIVQEARIITPTSQNQKAIQQDLMRLDADLPGLSGEDWIRRCEQAVRNYDPCLSCATH